MLTQKLARCSDVSRAARSPFQPFTMKRSRSDSDPEEGDGFERHHRSSAGVDGGDYDVGRAKKKRRGQIEKKRRDRINNSLAELRQLVPAAIQKQGSTKLEKAEILQLTVEHLRGLKYGSEISNGLAVTRGSELHTAGFSECIAEVSRCLSAVGHQDAVQCAPDKSEIFNRLNLYSSKEHRRFLPPLVTSNTKRETTGDTNSLLGTQEQLDKTQNWGLSFALNYPAIFPLRAHGTADILRSSFGHRPEPLMDWTMALVAKTNISAPSRHPWAP